LNRYGKNLKENGVFVVRLYTSENGRPKPRPTAMIGVIEKEFDVIENCYYGEPGVKVEVGQPGATVIVFRPKRAS
jgi:hypothetical protein